MKSRARWALLWLAAPVCALSPTYAWALDPTLPHPGKSPAFVPAPQRPASPPAVIPRPPPTTTAPAGNVVPSSPPSRTITPAAATGEPVASVRVPVPDAAAQKESQKLVDQIYRENIAGAKTPELKKQLAQTFLKAGIETTNDLAGKYVLLIRARDLAADIGDADMTLALGSTRDAQS